MQDHDVDNPYRVTGLVDERETRAFFFWIWMAKACAILPFVYMIAEIVSWMNPYDDLCCIFFAGVWFYAFIASPAALLIVFRISRVGLCYGIIINILFALCALFWLYISWNDDPLMTQGHSFPELFGIPIFLMRILYVVMYVGTIYVYIKAWRYLDWEKR